MEQVLKFSKRFLFPALILTMWSLQFAKSNLPPVGIPTFEAMARSMKYGPHLARIGEAPYHVSIHHHGFPVCNGALTVLATGEQAVVTLATCILVNDTVKAYPASGFVVVAGRINRKKLFGNEQSRKVRRIRYHRAFSLHPPYTPETDIAVLFLKEPFKLTSVVDTVPLPVEWHPHSKEYILTGWGTVNADDPVSSDLLLVARVDFYDPKKCEKKYSSIAEYFILYGIESLCLLGPSPHKGHCAAEKGSPVIGEAFAQPYLAGLYQWKHGKKCGDDWPGIYVNVRTFVEFLNSAAFENDIDTPDGLGK